MEKKREFKSKRSKFRLPTIKDIDTLTSLAQLKKKKKKKKKKKFIILYASSVQKCLAKSNLSNHVMYSYFASCLIRTWPKKGGKTKQVPT
jgi:hypothetical protein